ncbi:MAG: hypothetical protein HYY93_14835 [Planctomycetes bacterium]|nr:hypothetical protein [Planctomycetota bacterium]
MKRGILLTSLLAMTVAGYLLAQDHPEHPKKQPAEPKVIEATVVGENFCLGCALKKEKGAAAQCSKYGHRHALKVSSATGAGKDLPEMKGWILHYLDTDAAQPLIKEHHGETLTLKGKVYAEERVLEAAAMEEPKKPEHPEHPKK